MRAEDVSSGTGRVVLYVDDDESNRKLMFLLFAHYRPNDTLVSAGTVAEALDRIQECAPHLVVLDLTLPDGSGEDVLAHLMEEHAMPVIILSGHVDEATRRRLLEQGADAYFAKPLEITELFSAIETLIRRRDR